MKKLLLILLCVPLITLAQQAPSSSFSVDTVCLGTPSNFLNFSFGGVPPYSYLWDFGDGTTSVSQNPSHQYLACGSYVPSLIVTDANGLSDTSFLYEYIVNCPIVPNFNAPMVCEGEYMYFSDLSTTQSPYSFFDHYWNMGGTGTHSINPLSQFDSPNPIFRYDSCGTYIVTLIVGTTSYGGCQDSISQVVEVLCNPTANFFSPDTVCLLDTVCFTDFSISGSNPLVAWDWSLGSGVPNPCVVFTNFGVDSVTLSVTDASGCVDTYTQSIFIDSCNTSTGLNNYTTSRKLLKVTDILGRDTKPKSNIILFFIYSDGTVEKKIIIE